METLKTNRLYASSTTSSVLATESFYKSTKYTKVQSIKPNILANFPTKILYKWFAVLKFFQSYGEKKNLTYHILIIKLLTLLGEFCCEEGELIRGLGAAGGRGGGGLSTLLPALLFVSGVAGAEQVLLWGCEGEGLGERCDLGSDESDEGEEPGLLIDGSDTLLVTRCSCSETDDRWEAVAAVRGKAWSDEEEERLSVLRAGEGQAEED